MPLIACPECGHNQVVRGKSSGDVVICEDCGATYFVVGGVARRASRVDSAALPEPALTLQSIKRTVLLLGGLALLAGLFFAGLIGFVKYREAEQQREKERASQPPAPSSKPATPEEQKQREAERRSTLIGLGLIAIVIVALIVATVYVFALFAAGAWVARDAYNRGLPGLGWAAFYYLFHLLARFAVLPMAFVPALILPGVGLLTLLGAEPVAWVGLVVYLIARRGGRLTPCGNCRNRKLTYLVQCPHCGIPTPPAAQVEPQGPPARLPPGGNRP